MIEVDDYVIVTDARGSYSGVVKEVTPLAISVECNCCFAWRVCSPSTVRKGDITNEFAKRFK